MAFVDGAYWIADLSDLGYPQSAGVYNDRWDRKVEISQEHIDNFKDLTQDGGTPLLWGKQKDDGSYVVTQVIEPPADVNLRDYL